MTGFDDGQLKLLVAEGVTAGVIEPVQQAGGAGRGGFIAFDGEGAAAPVMRTSSALSMVRRLASSAPHRLASRALSGSSMENWAWTGMEGALGGGQC